MKLYRITTLVTLCAAILPPSIANAAGSVGIGGGFGETEYKSYSGSSNPIPMVQYRGERFFLRGLSAGAYVYKGDSHDFIVSISYLAKQFEASQSDDSQMRQLSDRHSTATVDATYQYKIERIGTLYLTGSADVLDETDGGMKVDTGFRSFIPLSKRLFLTPMVGVTWFNRELINHYYGVSGDEATRSGLSGYRAQSSMIPQAGIGIRLKMSEKVSAFTRFQYSWLGSEITDSPMVDKDAVLSAFAGVSVTY